MSNIGNHDAHLEALEKLKREVGPQDEKPHVSGYLEQGEYATLVYYWAGEARPNEVADGVINTLSNCAWAHRPQVAGGMAGAVLALCELYPDLAAAWRFTHPKLFARVREFQRTSKGDGAWNDFYIAQWFILRRSHKEEGADIIEKLLERILEGGVVGYEARRACETCAAQCKPFWIALQKGQEKRMAMRIIQ